MKTELTDDQLRALAIKRWNAEADLLQAIPIDFRIRDDDG